MPTTDKSPDTDKSSRSLGRPLGATEWAYLLGLLFLAVGIAIQFSIGTALIVVGGILTVTSIGTSFFVTWLAAPSQQPKEK